MATIRESSEFAGCTITAGALGAADRNVQVPTETGGTTGVYTRYIWTHDAWEIVVSRQLLVNNPRGVAGTVAQAVLALGLGQEPL